MSGPDKEYSKIADHPRGTGAKAAEAHARGDATIPNQRGTSTQALV